MLNLILSIIYSIGVVSLGMVLGVFLPIFIKEEIKEKKKRG